MSPKSQHLQIRVTVDQKARLKELAEASGQGMSEYVLSRVLADGAERFRALVERVADSRSRRDALAALNDLLTTLAPMELNAAVGAADLRELPPLDRNYIAAMVEMAVWRADVNPPHWVRDVEPLSEPFFATPLAALRPHLLKNSPVPFKRRNLFVDASIGDRV